ncbi:hypothetical protein B0H67DRAFT_536415, partial [Lasiosphaeris hirsuta]
LLACCSFPPTASWTFAGRVDRGFGDAWPPLGDLSYLLLFIPSTSVLGCTFILGFDTLSTLSQNGGRY